MPNHVINTIYIKKGNAQEFLERIKPLVVEDQEEAIIDFNRIIPMPDELVSTSKPPKIVSQEDYNNYEPTEMDKKLRLGKPITKKIQEELISNYGADNWYDWSVVNWGTKWNAYTQYFLDAHNFSFDTAWSPPEGIIKKIAEMFPDHVICWTWEEEQGFGEELLLENGDISVVREWDIPDMDDVTDEIPEDIREKYIPEYTSIYKCTNNKNNEDYSTGKYYVDHCSEEEYDSLEEIIETFKKQLENISN